MVLRVLGGAKAPDISALGLDAPQEAILQSSISQPQGMILVTGPTGSGKTTTLYALLAWHHKPEVNIVTVEDPIEYQLAGINQVQINPKAGLTFASALRSILRQDPDVILVGETRDRETAEIAFQASMTGHMVLSTLHTNSAVGAVSRMYDLGVDPAILATSLTMVVAQRLVRRICNDCREAYEPGEAVRNRVGLFGDASPVYRGRGCQACGGTGYAGRIGLYEMFRPTNAIRKLINDRASEADIRYAARQAGMVLLREDALEKVRNGVTSPDEVLRVVQVDETEIPCPSCKAIIEADFATCPYCSASLKATCAGCGQPLRREWKVCPHCNTAAKAQPAPLETRQAERPAAAAAGDTGVASRAQESVPSAPVSDAGTVVPPADAPVASETAAPASREAGPAPPATAEPAPGPDGTDAQAAAGAQAATPPIGRRPLRVLVVDDDADIRMIVRATLRGLPVPVEVVQAENGVEALAKARDAAPDFVILDVMMPHMDGFDTCRALRADLKTAFVPVLMLTASADQDSRAKGYLIGTDDYMAKPFLPVDLKLRVARLLRRTYGI